MENTRYVWGQHTTVGLGNTNTRLDIILTHLLGIKLSLQIGIIYPLVEVMKEKLFSYLATLLQSGFEKSGTGIPSVN